MKSIVVETPTRVDLAGGTLDLWPISQFYRGACTVNVAINQFARTEISFDETLEGFRFISSDFEMEKDFKNYSEILNESSSAFSLLSNAVHFFNKYTAVEPKGESSGWFEKNSGVIIKTKALSLVGAGLGGSSALLISIIGALNKLTGAAIERDLLPDIAKNIETEILHAPAGIQDYFPPLYGGMGRISFEKTGYEFHKMEGVSLETLKNHLSIVYSGRPHHSGMSNWEVLKREIDGDETVREALSEIVEITRELSMEMTKGNIESLGPLLKREWECRKKLSPAITTAEIENIIELASDLGATGYKVCGAGGGGCLLICSSDSKTMDNGLKSKGFHVVDYNFVPQGLVFS